MSEDRCLICGGIAPDGNRVCPTCGELMKDMPVEMEAVLWRPFPLIKPRITFEEYLITTEYGSVYISMWDGSDWFSTADPNRADTIIAWTNVPSPYKPKEGKRQ